MRAIRGQMRAIQVKKAGGPFELVQLPTPQPGPAEVLIKVIACGICGGDEVCRSGLFPGMSYPRIPGHEAVGTIIARGERVGSAWAMGQRVGVGWHAGRCESSEACEHCRRGNFFVCVKATGTGLTVDGGLAEYMVADQTALIPIPDALDSVQAAGLLCAGLTVFNAMRLSSIRPGDTLAVSGIGGLGHLALQFGVKFGYRVVAISSSASKRFDCLEKFGAHVFIDAKQENVPQRLANLRPKLILGTSVDAKSITDLTPTWPSDAQLLILAEPPTTTLEIPYIPLLFNRNSIAGFTAGTSADAEDALRVADMVGVVVQTETYALEDAEAAFNTIRGARYRRVVVM
ncbi:zinc-type alcohol dehydrogenase [Mycena belliarum]|uniref:Zinc-type alcohol dehydrogenase n=1 Tax=Mycena belliarum TaxID=1033014 RepID=A0AAD6XRS7_9AGAR|nr:zinc-type alcohol dehydrogenase [Mycena belliae]